MQGIRLETPSRIWRRIETADEGEMPSLPSLPALSDSADNDDESVDETDDDKQPSLGIQSTPAVLSAHHTAVSTIRPPSSTASTIRFANALASRSAALKSTPSHSRGGNIKGSGREYQSFDVSGIPAMSDAGAMAEQRDESSLPPAVDNEVHEVSLTEALESVSQHNSPYPSYISQTPGKKGYDYSVSLRSEPKPSPYDRSRNVTTRKRPTPFATKRTRTPSLTHTTSTTDSSSSRSTPQSNNDSHRYNNTAQRRHEALPQAFVPLPPSPAVELESEVIRASRRNSQIDVDENAHGSRAPSSHSSALSRRSAEMESREPTFSSEEAGSDFTAIYRHDGRSPTPLSVALSSPAPSALMTPTPAFQYRPRPRARFADPNPEYEPEPQPGQREPATPMFTGRDMADEDEDVDATPVPHRVEDPETPRTHKREFLLSVINSTARPRFVDPTPQPPRAQRERSQDRTPAPSSSGGMKLFAGATPRVLPRTTHPLTQTWTPSVSSVQGSEPGVENRVGGTNHSNPASPYNAALDRASFVSTGSSHDLTTQTYAKANASFDPVMGLAAQGHGVGRFNASKLNTYLHSLNRRLQEENETLVDKIRTLEDELEVRNSVSPGVQRSRSASRRRVSAVSELGDVSEAGWKEEKAALEDMLDDWREKAENCRKEKEEVERLLRAEKDARQAEEARHVESVKDLQDKVAMVVNDLEKAMNTAEKRAEVAEAKLAARERKEDHMLADLRAERDLAVQRGERAEALLQNGRGELGREVRDANERVAQAMGELRSAKAHIQDLEEEVTVSIRQNEALEKALRQQKDLAQKLDRTVQTTSRELSEAQERAKAAQRDAAEKEVELIGAREYISQLEEDTDVQADKIEQLEQRLGSVEDAADNVETFQRDAARANEMAKQMEDAAEAAEREMLESKEEVARLKGQIASLERDLQNAKNKADPSHRSPRAPEYDVEAEVGALEAELNDAHKEIGRLRAVLNQSPARKAAEKAKDAKMELLEKEKEELLERIKSLKGSAVATSTPSRVINKSGVSPYHRRGVAWKTPKTPGAPLKDLSWLQSSGVDAIDASVAPLLDEIARLQKDLDRANESIDDKIDKLQDAGLGVVRLNKKLEDARNRIAASEDEIGRLHRRDERRIRRLQRAKCPKCHGRIDLSALNRFADGDESSVDISMTSFLNESTTTPAESREALQTNLRSVNEQLESMRRQWQEEKRQLLGEKAVLQDAAKRLNSQIRAADDEVRRAMQSEKAGEKARRGVQEELERARQITVELEAELAEERSRLRAITSEKNRAEREKTDILLQMQRAEADMEEVKNQLQGMKRENDELEAELKVHATAEQKAQVLDAKLARNMATIEHLREERSILAADYKEMQKRLTGTSEHLNKLRKDQSASKNTHENRRQQLDHQLTEVSDLRHLITHQASEIQQINQMLQERGNGELKVLEGDLRRVMQEAEAFGRELAVLKGEKGRLEERYEDALRGAERGRREAEERVGVLSEELRRRDKGGGGRHQAEGGREAHVGSDDEITAALKLQHNKECKGLLVQIRYLKAKFTRESSLRDGLSHQKAYLLILLARFERSEQRILAAIARIGFAVPPVEKREKERRSLKSVVLTVVFIARARRASDSWREQRVSRQAINEALQDVHRRRAIGVA